MKNHNVPVNLPYRLQIDRFCRNILRNLKPHAIIMYGSMARGDYHEDSDVNLLVISDNIPLRFMDRSSLLDKFTPVKLPAEVLAYTGTEFDSMIENRHPTALSALEEGRVLCDDGYVKQAYQKYLKMRSRTGLKRIDIGWVAEKLVPSSLKT